MAIFIQLNSRLIKIPNTSTESKRVTYLGTTGVNPGNLQEEWALVKLTVAPENDTSVFWYVHSIAYTVDSNNHIVNGKQIAYGYSGQHVNDVYERTCNGGTWGSWLCVVDYTSLTLTALATGVTFIRQSCARVGDILHVSCAITVSQNVPDGSNFLSLPTSLRSDATNDILFTMSNKSYTAYAYGDLIKTNGAFPADTYFANATIKLS